MFINTRSKYESKKLKSNFVFNAFFTFYFRFLETKRFFRIISETIWCVTTDLHQKKRRASLFDVFNLRTHAGRAANGFCEKTIPVLLFYFFFQQILWNPIEWSCEIFGKNNNITRVSHPSLEAPRLTRHSL